MDFIITGLIYWIFNIFCPKNPVQKNVQSHKPVNEWGYFIFSEERGCNQSDNDPFLNEDYNEGGPDW